MIPLLINGKHLYQIFDPDTFDPTWDDSEISLRSIKALMLPTEVDLVSETYSRDTERTADYELEQLIIVNRKAKPSFTWRLIKADYVTKLMAFLEYTYAFKNKDDIVVPREAPTYLITYQDLTGVRTINAYLGQTIEGTLVEYDGVPYWENFRIAFPER